MSAVATMTVSISPAVTAAFRASRVQRVDIGFYGGCWVRSVGRTLQSSGRSGRPSSRPADEEISDDKEQNRQGHHQGGRRRDRRAQLLAQTREHFERQGPLLGAGEELDNDDFVKRRDESKGCS